MAYEPIGMVSMRIPVHLRQFVRAIETELVVTGPVDEFGNTPIALPSYGLTGTINLTLGGTYIQFFSGSDQVGTILVEDVLFDGTSISGLEDYIKTHRLQAFSESFGATFDGSNQRDFIVGEGTIRGRAGDDDLALTHSIDDPFQPATGPTGTSRAIGGAGNDWIISGVERAVLRGGAGDDHLEVYFGRAVMVGGSGADTFVFESGWHESRPNDAPAIGIIRDFNPLEDTIRFETGYDDPATHGITTGTQTLADIYGPGSLEDIGNVTIDGIQIDAWTNARGHTIIHRHGTTLDGDLIDEKVRIRNTDENDIDLASIEYANYDLA